MTEALRMAVERARYRDQHPEEEAPPSATPSSMSVGEMLDEVDVLADEMLSNSNEIENVSRLKVLASALRDRLT